MDKTKTYWAEVKRDIDKRAEAVLGAIVKRHKGKHGNSIHNYVDDDGEYDKTIKCKCGKRVYFGTYKELEGLGWRRDYARWLCPKCRKGSKHQREKENEILWLKERFQIKE